ncbi:MAG TPA: C2H2-type zinc finger protein [Anaerolineae bacterium]|nr:C2H2-type zinc finger protein [Anaerolineae bacterium]
MKHLRDSSLWLVGLGLMLASSGLDGVYMAQWMPAGWGWLGLVLNTMSDVGNLTLAYWYTRLRQTAHRRSRRFRLANVLLAAELASVAYGWFFAWRQLRFVLPAIEPEHWRWVAPIAALFIPLLLAFIGWAQALLAGKLGDDVVVQEAVVTEQPEPLPEPQEQWVCQECGKPFGSYYGLNAHMRVHKPKLLAEAA